MPSPAQTLGAGDLGVCVCHVWCVRPVGRPTRVVHVAPLITAYASVCVVFPREAGAALGSMAELARSLKSAEPLGAADLARVEEMRASAPPLVPSAHEQWNADLAGADTLGSDSDTVPELEEAGADSGDDA